MSNMTLRRAKDAKGQDPNLKKNQNILIDDMLSIMHAKRCILEIFVFKIIFTYHCNF